jgi:hypothetical protein
MNHGYAFKKCMSYAEPKPAAHLCDLVEIKIAVCSLCDGSGRNHASSRSACA